MAKAFGFLPRDVEEMDPDDVQDLKTMAVWLAKNTNMDTQLSPLWRMVI